MCPVKGSYDLFLFTGLRRDPQVDLISGKMEETLDGGGNPHPGKSIDTNVKI